MKIIQAWGSGLIPDDIQESINLMRKYCQTNSIKYELIRFNDKGNPALESNLLRFHMATKDPDMLWVDCDVEFDKTFTLGLDFSKLNQKNKIANANKLKPYFAMTGKYAVCNGIFYVNSNTHFFRDLLDEVKRRNIDTGCYNWASKVLNRWPNRIQEFPKIYKHKFNTMSRKTESKLSDHSNRKQLIKNRSRLKKGS